MMNDSMSIKTSLLEKQVIELAAQHWISFDANEVIAPHPSTF
jgi:hypothetical protein